MWVELSDGHLIIFNESKPIRESISAEDEHMDTTKWVSHSFETPRVEYLRSQIVWAGKRCDP